MDAVVVEHRGDVALLRLNRPDSRNALTAELKDGLAASIPRLVADPGTRCIVVTGTGPAFCAGGDIRNMADRRPHSVKRRMEVSYGWVRPLLLGDTPVVAAVNGAAAGAGFSLAMVCDLVLVGEGGFFQAGFPGLGAVPDLGLAMTLPRAIGTMRARELLLTNRRVESQEAVALGMALARHPDDSLLDAALALAERVARGPKTSLGLTRQMMMRAYEPPDEFLAHEAYAQSVAFASEDFAEGVDAFLGKRKPDFPAASRKAEIPA